MPKHHSEKIWMIRKEGQSNGYVQTNGEYNIHIYYYANQNDPSTIFEMDITRTDARILARRLIECLDATK